MSVAQTGAPKFPDPSPGPEWIRNRSLLLILSAVVLALVVGGAVLLLSSAGDAIRNATGLGGAEWTTTRRITSANGIPFKMRISLVSLSIEPNQEYCAPTTSPGTSNALVEVTWTNDSDRAATPPVTSIDLNASRDPGSSFLAGSIRFTPCRTGLGAPSPTLEPGQSLTVRGVFPGVPESGISGFYLIIYGMDGGLYGKPLDTVKVDTGESADGPTAADTIRSCAAEGDRIEAALKKWSKDKKDQYSGPVSIDELVPDYLPERPTLFEYAPGGYPSDIKRGVVGNATLTAKPPCTGDRTMYFVYGG